MRAAISCVLITAVSLASQSRAAEVSGEQQFFANLTRLCGRTIEGATEFPQNPDHPMVGRKLVLTVGPCSAKEVRIALQVGEDKSRTWIFTRSENVLLFKHDHRPADATPPAQTNYGGWARPGGTGDRQQFAADEETAKLIPEAATNVWTLEFDHAKSQLIYALERHNAPRYKAVFQLRPE